MVQRRDAEETWRLCFFAIKTAPIMERRVSIYADTYSVQKY